MSNKKINLIGQRFGRLTVISDAGIRTSKNGRKFYIWNCACDCGNTSVVTTSNLRGNKVLSCGCYKKDRAFEANYINLQGKTFGRLTAISYIHKNGKLYWKCKCVCGNYVDVIPSSLIRGETRSCGCYQREIMSQIKRKKSIKQTRLYRIWGAMKYRCYNPNCHSYPRYGGRGIEICDEWKNNFLSFQTWALQNGYNDFLSIDRKDCNGNYTPENCRWADAKQQAMNRSSTRFIEYKGEQKSIYDWSVELKINYDTLIDRINKGLSMEKIMNTPIKTRGRYKPLSTMEKEQIKELYNKGVSKSALCKQFYTSFKTLKLLLGGTEKSEVA